MDDGYLPGARADGDEESLLGGDPHRHPHADVDAQPHAHPHHHADTQRHGDAHPTPTNCYEAIKNGGFEAAGNWDIATTPRSARFTGDIVHGGSVALLTGIKTGESNVKSHSSAGQLFMIPVNATSVTLRYYRQRYTEEAPASAKLPKIADGTALDRSLLPYDQDWQEVLLLDSYYNVLAFVERGRGNDSGWVERTYDLTSYRGRWVVLYFNTYNDGAGGVSWMLVDDVSVGVCR